MSYRSYIWRKSNPEKRTLEKQREKVRRKLRDRGFLPPVGAEMSIKQKNIYKEIGNDNYTFWDSVKLNGGTGRLHDGGRNHIRVSFKSPEYRVWYRAKESAKKRTLDFNIDIDDIFIPEFCPYLGIKLSTNQSENHMKNYYSIDRKNSTKGYVKGNVQIISNLANTMKNNSTDEELIIFAQNILKISKNF